MVGPTNPYADAIASGVHTAEMTQLTRQRDRLAQMAGKSELDVLRSEVAALEQVAAQRGLVVADGR